jgi:O-methyltransferase involved in polyketide biosynthesis
VDDLDDPRRKLLLAIAPYADEAYISAELLESMANLSKKQPFEANEIWLKVLEGSAPDYPEEAIQQILSNLIASGDEGKRLALKTVSEYLKKGIERPSILLRELMNNS